MLSDALGQTVSSIAGMAAYGNAYGVLRPITARDLNGDWCVQLEISKVRLLWDGVGSCATILKNLHVDRILAPSPSLFLHLSFSCSFSPSFLMLARKELGK
jgi:hypothetical protein